MPRLCIEKSGMVRSGHIDYEVNVMTGEIRYSGRIKVKKGWISKTFKKSGTYRVDPEKLESVNFDEKGESMDMGHGTHARVIAANHGISLVSVISKQYNGTGEIELDITKPVISIRRLNLNVRYMGMSFTLKAHLC